MTAPDQPPPPRQRLLRDMALGALLALALAAAAYLLLPKRGQGPTDLGTEGTGRLELRVERAAGQEQAPGGALQPGDTVRFSYVHDEPGYLTVLVADSAEHVQVHYPSGVEAARWSPDEPAVPGEFVLQAPLPTAFAAVLCPQPIAVATVRSAMDPEASPAERFAIVQCQIDTAPLDRMQ